MQAILVMFRSDGERRSFSVTRDMTVIGRREDCDLRIPLGEISRKHARLVRDGDTLRLEDLGSSNGTFLNGQRIQESLLNPGDSIQIGPVVFVLQIDGYPADEDLHPVIAEMSEQTAEPVSADIGPLSPTAQSEYENIEHLEPLPGYGDDAGVGLEPLPLSEDDAPHAASPGSSSDADLDVLPELPSDDGALELAPTPPKVKAAKPAAPPKAPAKIEDDLDLENLPELDDNAGLELLADEPHHGAHDEPIDLDMGLDSPPQPHA